MSTALAHRATITPDEWPMVRQQADMLVKTGFLPPTIKTPEQAVAIMMKGRELGVPPMYALSNIAVISGKPACTAELMLALLYRDHGDAALQVTETTAQRCAAAYKRRGWREAQTFAFTIEDAKTAGLSGGNWAKYPAAMLRARCISAIARMAFPDSIGGMYTAEELGAAVNGETGEILDAPAPPPAPKASTSRPSWPSPTSSPEPRGPGEDGPEPVSLTAVATGQEPEADEERQELLTNLDALREVLRLKGVDVAALEADLMPLGDGAGVAEIRGYGAALKQAGRAAITGSGR